MMLLIAKFSDCFLVNGVIDTKIVEPAKIEKAAADLLSGKYVRKSIAERIIDTKIPLKRTILVTSITKISKIGNVQEFTNEEIASGMRKLGYRCTRIHEEGKGGVRYFQKEQ